MNGRPPALTEAQRREVAGWGVPAKAAHERALGLGWECSEATIRRIIDRGTGQRAVEGVRTAPMPRRAAALAGPCAPAVRGETDDAEVLAEMRELMLAQARSTGGGPQGDRLRQQAALTVERLTDRLRKIRKLDEPKDRAGVLLLPAEEPTT